MADNLLDVEQPQTLNPTSLTFQDFSSTQSRAAEAAAAPPSGGAIGSSMVKPGQILQPVSGGGGGMSFESDSGGAARTASSSGFWTIKYYQPLFDVDTLQVLDRIKGALMPRPKGAFFEAIAPNPDLYGPFWIATTLIFTMAMVHGLASYLSFTPTAAKKTWTYDFSKLTLAGSVIYSYVTLLPLLYWVLLRYYEASKKLVEVLCIYGYTLSIFVPISILCIIPSDFLRWLFILLGGAVSAIFLLSNFHAHLADCFPYGEGDAKKKMYLVLGSMGVFHVVICLLFKIVFFHYYAPDAR